MNKCLDGLFFPWHCSELQCKCMHTAMLLCALRTAICDLQRLEGEGLRLALSQPWGTHWMPGHGCKELALGFWMLLGELTQLLSSWAEELR